MTGQQPQTTDLKKPDMAARNRRTAGVLFSVAGGMVGLAFASVPLYQLFCQVTGYGGTPQTVDVQAPGSIPAAAVGRTITVTFDSNVSKNLEWRFKPVQREMVVHLGEPNLAFYEATNRGQETVSGTATFNVTPFKAGPYFSKIQCFCFDEQALKAGESVSMPVQFFVDPKIFEDPNTRDVTNITLSYTFFKNDGDDEDDGAEPETVSSAETLSGTIAKISPDKGVF